MIQQYPTSLWINFPERVLTMEFHEKLQELRKRKGLTQEELAQKLYVSRTAISKWESGRGYPSIESLKLIANFFSVTIDELLSCDEVLSIAQHDNEQKEGHYRDLICGLLDCSVAIFLFLPFFGQKVDGVIQEIPLLSLTEPQLYLRVLYFLLVAAMILTGILTLALQNCSGANWQRIKRPLSLLLSVVSVLLFTMSLQPYAAAFLFVFLAIKVLILIKKA